MAHDRLMPLFCGLLLVCCREAEGAPVSPAQAGQAVAGWLKTDQAPLATRLGQRVKRTDTYNGADGQPLYHVVYLEPEGFVIVAADDLAEPVVGFASGGLFDPSDTNPLGALVGSDLPGRLARARNLRTPQALQLQQAAQDKWNTLLRAEQGAPAAALSLASVSDLRVAPFVKSQWSQSYTGTSGCYNYYVPPYGDGAKTNYPCGCVATAMAQLMRYWQYPKVGVGTGTFTIYTNGLSLVRSLRGGDGAGGAYDWGNMSLTNGSSATAAQRQAIGALCHDAGVSVNMDYAAGGSGTDTLKARTAFVSTFKYSNAVKGYQSGYSIGAGLVGMVNPNLDAACPVLFGISGSSGGHAVICDGYGYNLATLYHHLNMGWSGTSDAWYDLPNIGSYTSLYKCVYNVWTNGTGEIISGRVTDCSGIPLAGVAVTAVRAGGGSYSATTDARGVYALPGVPSSSQYTVSAAKTGYAFVAQAASTGQSSDFSSTSGNRWGVDLSPDSALEPSDLVATPANASGLALSWALNAAQDNVMVAWNTNAVFGVPAGAYAVGDAIADGGTVLYVGSATNLTHTGLANNTRYYYKVWSVMSGPSYSSGKTCSAKTLCCVPFTEGFENAGTIPEGWSQEFVTGSVSWLFQNGGHTSVPASAHGGSCNALLYYGATSDHTTRLVTPAVNFGLRVCNAQLTFWHCMAKWGSDQDQLRVCYRTAAGGAWTLLATYTNSVTSWTQRTVALPDPNNTYYIGFEGNAKYGYGVCIDDVAVTADLPPANSFMAWAQSFCPGAALAEAFAADRDGDGVPNGFEYAFGTNWVAGTPLLNVFVVSGAPVVDIPKQLPASEPYVGVSLEMTRSLVAPGWSTNGLQAVDDAAEPANRTWLRPVEARSNGFFRLRGVLK